MPRTLIRCPYCVDGSNFRVMRAVANGDWHQCEVCAHVIMPHDPDFKCTCENCLKLTRA